MLIEVIRLTLFPAMMAFAASSDLFTMTIANRVSLILVGGFVLLALLTGMSGHDMLIHAGVAAAVLVVAFGCFTCGWIGGGDETVFNGRGARLVLHETRKKGLHELAP